MTKKILCIAVLLLAFCGACFAQVQPAAETFQPFQPRCLSYDSVSGKTLLYIDKAGITGASGPQILASTRELFGYFLVGLALPDSAFWVNLRPDTEDSIIDDGLARTDAGRILLESDVQLKADLSRYTSPRTPEGREYWDRLYRKAAELFGTEERVIPTVSRPWIVPGEIILQESPRSAYIYKASLQVKLEQDHLKAPAGEAGDPRVEELSAYSAQLLRELVLPKLTREVNTAARYSRLRQVYHCLILSQWFKARFADTGSRFIDGKDLTGLTSARPWSKHGYYAAYKKSFSGGEYTFSERRYSLSGQSIRTYAAGGTDFTRAFPGMMMPGLFPSFNEPVKAEGLVPVSVFFNLMGNSFAVSEMAMTIAGDQPRREMVQPDVPLSVPYSSREFLPVSLINEDAAIMPWMLEDEQFLLERLAGNLYYANAPPERRQKIVERVKSLLPAVPYIKEYVRLNYPDLEVVNISVYGSYIKGVAGIAASDIDVLILVRGNRFSTGDEIPVQRGDPRLAAIAPHVNQWSIYIIGVDNMEKGEYDMVSRQVDAAEQPRWIGRQRAVTEAAVPVLARRNIVLDGKDFKENKGLYRQNLLARASELLYNAYRRMYLYKLVSKETEPERWRIAASRLHDTYLSLKEYDPALVQDMSEEEVLDLRFWFEREYLVDLSGAKARVEQYWIRLRDRFETAASGKFRPAGYQPVIPAGDTARPPVAPPMLDGGTPGAAKPGGIDFRVLSFITDPAPAAMFVNPVVRMARDAREREWRGIERMIRTNAVPSAQRIREYAQAAIPSGDAGGEAERIIGAIAGILAADETAGRSSDPLLRELISSLEFVRLNESIRASFPDPEH